MSVGAVIAAAPLRVAIEELGVLQPVSRLGGQGRVYRPARRPESLPSGPLLAKLYRRAPPSAAVHVLDEMVAWGRALPGDEGRRLHRLTAWPLGVLSTGGVAAGIAMHDLSARFSVPFAMPSGRREPVLLSLEHLLGHDGYLQLRGLEVRLDTTMRLRVAERVSDALAFLHRHAIAASDIAPSNLLVAFRPHGPEVCFIDCDSMVFRGRQALPAVETGDWQMPAEFDESAQTRSADAYKLGLVVLRLLTRSHDARILGPHRVHVPAELRELLARALSSGAANRPPAGEWQRALRQSLLAGGLSECYPGPLAAARAAQPTTRAPRRPTRPPPATAGRRPSRGATTASPRRPASPRSRSSTSPGTQLLGALAWIAIGIVLFTLVLSRLLAGAVPAYGPSGFDPAGPAAGSAPQVYQYQSP